MPIILLTTPQAKSTTSIIDSPKIITTDLKISTLDHSPTLNELLSYSLLPSKTPQENIFRAKELYDNLHAKFVTSNIDKVLSPYELERFNKVLIKLQKIKSNGQSFQETINPTDAETLMEIFPKLESLQEEKDKKLKTTNSLDSIMNTISDKIMTILLQEALTRGSYINLALSIARLNPLVEIPDESDLKEHLKNKVLTQEFKNCLLENIKGNKCDKSKLTSLQKQFFFFANIIVWTIAHMPEFAIKYVPRLGKVTRLSVNLIEQIPIAGSLINKFFVPVDEAIKIIEKHPDEIRTLRKEAKQVKLLSKMLDTAIKLKDEGLNLLQKLFS